MGLNVSILKHCWILQNPQLICTNNINFAIHGDWDQSCIIRKKYDIDTKGFEMHKCKPGPGICIVWMRDRHSHYSWHILEDFLFNPSKVFKHYTIKNAIVESESCRHTLHNTLSDDENVMAIHDDMQHQGLVIRSLTPFYVHAMLFFIFHVKKVFDDQVHPLQQIHIQTQGSAEYIHCPTGHKVETVAGHCKSANMSSSLLMDAPLKVDHIYNPSLKYLAKQVDPYLNASLVVGWQ
ncbi:hypothetical protein BDR04DRAFT_1121494 [Suillus decipiens]|nr:hypothetical protein BDR04DRAFT_1121494 [Suillus decipiens]